MSHVNWDGVIFTNEGGKPRVEFEPGVTVKRSWDGFVIYKNGYPVSHLHPTTLTLEFDILSLLDEVCK